jgi:hypothetical protein
MMASRLKHLKSKSKEIMVLFKNSILVRDICEDLKSCNVYDDASAIRVVMKKCDFDVYGLEKNERIFGYVKRLSLKDGLCGKYQNTFHPWELVAESTSLIDVLPLLRDNPRMFVLERNCVSGIITRGDLQKSPFRMLSFGLISLLEMNLLKIIRNYYPVDSWKYLLTDTRIKKAEQLLNERKRRNEAVDLADCLQFCDKRSILLETPEIVKKLDYKNITELKALLEKIESLRDRLAHSQDIIAGSSWGEVINIIEKLDVLLQRCEEIN